MRLVHIRLGTNDLKRSRAFYDATFGALGLSPCSTPTETSHVISYQIPGGLKFSIGPARNGQPATYANGGTILFTADSDEAVAAWHAAGLANGGSCDGKPEPKPQAGGIFGAYVRDPDGNKLGCYQNRDLS